MSRSFLDGNLLIYLATSDAVRVQRVEELLRENAVISVQVLNETAHVLRRKAGFSWAEVRSFLGLSPPAPPCRLNQREARRPSAPRP